MMVLPLPVPFDGGLVMLSVWMDQVRMNVQLLHAHCSSTGKSNMIRVPETFVYVVV